MKIGVVALGLIGGSIFKALQKSAPLAGEVAQSAKCEVVGVSGTVKTQNVSSDYNTLVDCDLVFVCTPMSKTLETLEKLDKILSPKTIVTDVCSLKEFVSKKKYNFNFIPSHPMAGTEKQGWENSFPELFNGAKWVITPLDGIISDGIDVLEEVIRTLGAEVIITTPEEHDKAVAYISHMPLVIAQALCENIKDNKLAQLLASSGFRDTTRLALSNLSMAEDMVNMNKNNIDDAINHLKLSINELLENDYPLKAKQIKSFRENLYS